MQCPNCRSILIILHLQNQVIAHCSNCGGSLFEPNGINKLSLDEAKSIVELSRNTKKENNIEICPYDGKKMNVLYQNSIPNFITLFSCPECSRVWGLPQDIIDFKIAQKTLIEYHQAWKKPLPALRSVLIMGIMLTVGLSSFYVFFRHSSNFSSKTQAENIIKSVNFEVVGDAVMIYFTTSTKYKSEILFTDPKGLVFKHKIAEEPSTLHTAVFTQYPFDGTYSLRIRLISDTKTETLSPIKFEPIKK